MKMNKWSGDMVAVTASTRHAENFAVCRKDPREMADRQALDACAWQRYHTGTPIAHPRANRP